MKGTRSLMIQGLALALAAGWVLESPAAASSADVRIVTSVKDWNFVTAPHDLDVLLQCGHAQGLACDDSGVYFSHMGGIVKFGWDGKKIAEAKVPEKYGPNPHVGDCFAYKGKVYAVVSFDAFRQPQKDTDDKEMRGMICVWNAADLKPLGGKRQKELADGCVVLDDILYTCLDLRGKNAPDGNDRVWIRRYDMDLNDLGVTEVDLGFNLYYGIQTLATDGKNIIGCCYALKSERNPKGHNTAVLSPDLKALRSFHVWGSEGLCKVPESVSGKTKNPYFCVTSACGGNMQGWRKDPVGNPPRLRLLLFEYKDE